MNTNTFGDFQKMNEANMETAMKFFGEWGKSWQAIAAEVADYTKRSFEEGTAVAEKLATAKSLEQAFEIQSDYAKSSYEDYMQQMTKLSGMYAELAQEAYKPFEKALSK